MKNNMYANLMVLVFSIGVLTLSFLIIRPLLTPLLAALILSYLFYPLYILFMDKLFKNRGTLAQKISALLVLLAIICVVLVPIVTLVVLLFKNIELKALPDLFSALSARIVSFITANLGFLDNGLLKEFGISTSLNNSLAAFFGRVFIIVRDLFSQIPQFLLGSFVTLFVTYYLLRNAQPLVQFTRTIVPLSRVQFNSIMARFNGLCRGMVISQVVIAVIQGILVSIAALILGLGNIVLLGLITVVFAVIPFLGVQCWSGGRYAGIYSLGSAAGCHCGNHCSCLSTGSWSSVLSIISFARSCLPIAPRSIRLSCSSALSEGSCCSGSRVFSWGRWYYLWSNWPWRSISRKRIEQLIDLPRSGP